MNLKKLKEIIKSQLPSWAVKFYHNLTNTKKKSIFYGKNTEEIFNYIFENNHWGNSESISGSGSDLKQTKSIINSINILLKSHNITSLLDIPCGDFNWMAKVDLNNIQYTGADIVKALVDTNNTKYSYKKNLIFKKLNLIKDDLPKVDLVLTRDCLVHLSNIDIFDSLKNIKKSGSKYLLTTTFINTKVNEDISTGDWRPLNLEKRPFNFPKPLLIINENCTEQNGFFQDKSLGLWYLDDINLQ
jgi:hypothetical protein